ncbi:MAG: DNA sulfur modification protein DndE [Candidatus Nitrosopelagicus sp.]|nr:DNA sulfur modification protein DndE [Candidatus Nitrosopelagicus sp.]
MKFSRLKLSGKSQNLLGRLKNRTGLTPNIVARFALCISIKEKSAPIIAQYDKEGSEIEPSVLFGEYEDLYLGLMKNRLKKDGLSYSELNEMTRCHINRGVIALAPRIQNIGDFYDLIKEERNV